MSKNFNAQSAEAERGWTPVRNGAVYCSPRCGFKCTWTGYLDAHNRANGLVTQLGPGWQPKVWENGRWNWAAEKGEATLHPNVDYTTGEPRSWTLFFNVQPQTVIRSTDTNPPMTPQQLVETGAAQAREMADHLHARAQALLSV